MHQKLIVSKHTNAHGHQSLTSQIAPSNSNRHLDYQLKEKEAQLIKSKLPIEFLLVNLQNDELRKYQQEYKGNALKNGLFVSKPDIMQQKKNEKKNQAKEKGRTSLAMSMQKMKENYGLKYLQKQGKSIRQESLIGKPPTQEKTEQKNKNGLINDTRMWGNQPTLARYQNLQKSHFYNQNNLIPQIQNKHHQNEHLQTVRNFPPIYSQGANDMQSNHQMLPMEYPYLNNYHQNLHYYNPVYQIPFLQSGQLRYDQKYFQPKEGESKEKHNLFRLFGLPFNEKFFEVPKLNNVQKSFCLNFLRKLRLHQSSEIFRNPVSPQFQRVPDYHYIIYQPMDLQTIHNKVVKDAYREISQFHADINKIIVSSYKYNERVSPSFVATVQFEDYYFEILKQVKRRPEDFINQQGSKKKGERKQEKEIQYLIKLKQNKKGDNVSRTESEKNLKSTKVSKQKGCHDDDNSQVFYQEMISQPNYHQYQQENMINHISAESERKGNVMVHHRKHAKNNSSHAISSSQSYQPPCHQNYQPQNRAMKLSPENKSMSKLYKKESLEDSIIEETRKQIEKSNFSQNIKKSSLIKEQNEKLQQFMKNQENHQRNEQQEQIDNLKHFKFDLDENSMQSKSVKQPSQNNTHKNIQRPLLFRSEISFDKLDKLLEDPKQIKQTNNNVIQFPSNIPATNITRKPSRTHISKEDDEEQFEIPSKIQLFDCEPSLKKSNDEQTKKIELSIPLEAVRMIQELDKEQQQQKASLKQQLQKKSSKGELLEYIALLDTESNKYRNLQKESQTPQINAPFQQTDTHLHQSNLGNFDVDPPYQAVIPEMVNQIPVKQRPKKKRRILNDEENSDESGYDEYLQKQLLKLDKSKKVQKMKSLSSYLNNSSEQQAQKRRSKNIKRVQENGIKINSLPNQQQMPVNVNHTIKNSSNLPSQISIQQPNKLLANHAKSNVESTSVSHTSQSHNPRAVPVQHPKEIFMEKDQENNNVEEPGIDFTDFFS